MAWTFGRPTTAPLVPGVTSARRGVHRIGLPVARLGSQTRQHPKVFAAVAFPRATPLRHQPTTDTRRRKTGHLLLFLYCTGDPQSPPRRRGVLVCSCPPRGRVPNPSGGQVLRLAISAELFFAISCRLPLRTATRFFRVAFPHDAPGETLCFAQVFSGKLRIPSSHCVQ